MKKKFLVTGFEPFLDVISNPTESLVKSLKAHDSYQYDLILKVLPVEYDKSWIELQKVIETVKPDLILSFGVARSRFKIEFERIGINFRSRNVKDNSGDLIGSSTLIESGPDGIFTNLNLDEVIENLKTKGIEVGVSNSAGTYVCNSLFYKTLNMCKSENCLIGFVHVPLEYSDLKELINTTVNILDSIFKVHFK